MLEISCFLHEMHNSWNMRAYPLCQIWSTGARSPRLPTIVCVFVLVHFGVNLTANCPRTQYVDCEILPFPLIDNQSYDGCLEVRGEKCSVLCTEVVQSAYDDDKHT